MSLQFKNLYRALLLALAAQAACAADSRVNGVRPSDCRPKDADSTCATAVAGAGAPVPIDPLIRPLYDNSIGGVPPTGYAYWGYDFASDAAGVPSPFPDDMFVNRSPFPVTITLSFTIPTSHACGADCLPAVQFEVDATWIDVRPRIIVQGSTATATYQARSGQAYGWVIGLWQSTNPRLTVTLAAGTNVSLDDVGLPADLSTAREVPAVVSACYCWDGSSAACSLGNRYSNGLMGYWYRSNEFYVRAGAFNSCPPER